MSGKNFSSSQLSQLFYEKNIVNKKLKLNSEEFNKKIPVVALKHKYD